MNAYDLFAVFDSILVGHASDFSVLSDEKNTKKIVSLKEITTLPDGKFLGDLFRFLGWLIEDVEREAYFSKQCNVKFLNIQSNLDLVKVSISASSRCLVHVLKSNEQFIRYCSILWIDHCAKIRNAHIPEMSKTNSLDSLFTSSFRMSKGDKISRICDDNLVNNKAVTLSVLEENIQLLRMRYALTLSNGNTLLGNRFSMRKVSESAPLDLFLRSAESSEILEIRHSFSEDSKNNLNIMVQQDECTSTTVGSSSDSESAESNQSVAIVPVSMPSPSSTTLTDTSNTCYDNPGDGKQRYTEEFRKKEGSTKEQPNLVDSNSSHSGKDKDDLSSIASEKPSRVVKVKLSHLPTNAKELCALFKIKTDSIFAGAYLDKQFDKDFIHKRRFIWVDASTRSLNWAKIADDREKNPKACKFLLLKRFFTKKKTTQGLSQGVAFDVSFNSVGMNIITESGAHFRLKIPEEAQPCWQKIVLILRN